MPRDKYAKKKTPIRQNTKIDYADTKGIKSETRHYCSMCGEAYPTLDRNFPKVNSSFWAGRDGYLPLCKKCLEKIFDHYFDAYGGDQLKTIRRVCMLTDLYYSDSAVNAIKDGRWKGQHPIHRYISRINLTQYDGKTYDTTIDEERNSQKSITVFEPEQPQPQAQEHRKPGRPKKTPDDVKLVERWGTGLKPSDYEILEDHYKMLKRNNPNVDRNQEIFIKDLCTINLMKSNATKDSNLDAFVKASEQYSKIFTKAGLKTVEEKDSSNTETLGVTLATISKYTPEEFYSDKKLYEDYDMLGEYIDRFMTRPLINIVKGTDIRDEEFSVQDDSEDIQDE